MGAFEFSRKGDGEETERLGKGGRRKTRGRGCLEQSYCVIRRVGRPRREWIPTVMDVVVRRAGSQWRLWDLASNPQMWNSVALLK